MALITRLLCIKRPDYFITLNKANMKNLCAKFNITQTEARENYWDTIIAPILKTDWWKSKKPQNNEHHEQDIWDSRLAMLDQIFYTWDEINPMEEA